MQIRKLTINGVTIDDCRRGTIDLEMEYPNTDGYPDDHRQNQPALTVRRKATGFPSTTLFDLVTNGNGSLKLFDGSVEVEDQQNKDAYVFTFKRAAISDWRLSQDDSNLGGCEEIEIRAEELTCDAGGSTATVNVTKNK